MVDSELYEDADSKRKESSKNNTPSIYQDFQSKINNFSKRNQSKGNESSIYQDAQSNLSNNSGLKNNINNSFIKMKQAKNGKESKKKYLKNNNSFSKNNFEKVINTDIMAQKINKENEEEYNINYNNKYEYNEVNQEDKVNESYYSEPDANNIAKTQTIFEGESKRGGCCNIPKCIII